MRKEQQVEEVDEEEAELFTYATTLPHHDAAFCQTVREESFENELVVHENLALGTAGKVSWNDDHDENEDDSTTIYDRDNPSHNATNYSYAASITAKVLLIVLATWFLLYSKLRGLNNLSLRGKHNNNQQATQQQEPHLCGCSLCADLYMCKERVEWLLQEYATSSSSSSSMSQNEACHQVAQTYPYHCAVCHPDCTNNNNNNVIDDNALAKHSEIEAPLYCFPPARQRTRYTVWGGHVLEVKQSAGTESVCGPRQNHFAATGVNMVLGDMNGNDDGGDDQLLVLRYQNNQAAEVRILRPHHEAYTYGTFSFWIQNITVTHTVTGQVLAADTTLPDTLILSMSTYDPDIVNNNQEEAAHDSKHHHQVGINLGRWSRNSSNSNSEQHNVAFSMEPAAVHEFYAPRLAHERYSFDWRAGSIAWHSSTTTTTAAFQNNTESFQVTTENLLANNPLQQQQQQQQPTDIPCLPDRYMDVRISLFSAVGKDNDDLADLTVQVVLAKFDFVPYDKDVTLAMGAPCAQSCQCQATAECVLNTCQEI